MRKIYLLMLSGVLCSSVALAQKFVTQDGAGNKDGSNWANAYDASQLQAAINAADAETDPTQKQVWVAKGIYKPTESLSSTGFLTDGTTSVTNRDKTFILKAGVAIYGGFAGGESVIGDRTDITTTNETILSGDLNDSNTADNSDCYHVVSSRNASSGAMLDGFTIKYGYADGGDTITENGEAIPQNRGAGIAIQGASVGTTFKNLVIKNCEATDWAGGVWASGSGFDFEKVRFENNKGYRGGGAYINLSGTLVANFTDCRFFTNSSSDVSDSGGAGALYVAGGEINISNTHFDGNTTQRYGGAMRINGGTTVNISNNTIFENGDGVGRGGAIYSTGTSIVNIDATIFRNNISSNVTAGHYFIFAGTVNVTNSTFEDGTSNTAGGAIYINGGDFTATGTIFKNNTSTTNGGAIYNGGGTMKITSCQFISNTNNGTTGGGAIYASNGPVKISKSKFYSNTSASGGGAIYFTAAFDYAVDNCLFYDNKTKATGNTGGAIYHTTVNSTLTITNSTFYANKSAATVGAALSHNSTANVKLYVYNCIFNGNVGGYDFTTQTGGSSSDIRSATTATQNYSNNIFQTTFTNGTSGQRTIANAYTLGANPLFANPTAIPTDYNFLYPASNSFAKDKGNNNFVPRIYSNDDPPVDITETTATDLLGNPRFIGTVDLGAIEWSTVLPVKVSSFTTSLVNNRTQLKWSVGTEDNVNRYEVERSQNGVDFVKVAAIIANGSSSYQTTDSNPQVGDNYYRLVTIDNDGSRSQYGTIGVVRVGSLAVQNIQVYPNPVKGNEVKVSLGNAAVGIYGYKVVSTSGSVVQQGSISYNGSSAVINLSPAVVGGVYVLHFSNGTQAKLIKQ